MNYFWHNLITFKILVNNWLLSLIRDYFAPLQLSLLLRFFCWFLTYNSRVVYGTRESTFP
jgi:hypothetical protein